MKAFENARRTNVVALGIPLPCSVSKMPIPAKQWGETQPTWELPEVELRSTYNNIIRLHIMCDCVYVVGSALNILHIMEGFVWSSVHGK